MRVYPDTLNIFLTKWCNLSCSYCFVNKESSKAKELDIEALKKAVDFFLRFPGDYKTMSFSGGEPLLKFGKVKKLIQYTQQKNNGSAKLVVAVTTNGTLLTESRYKFLKSNRIILKVSIDGNKTTHDCNRPFKQRRYGSSYNRIMKNLNKMHRSNTDKSYKINAQLTFTPSSVQNLLENIKFLWRVGFDYIDFYPDLYSQWSNDNLNKMEVEFKKFTDFYISIFEDSNSSEDIFKNSLLHNFVNATELYKPILCQKIHLDWDGNFYCCNKVFSLPETKRKEFIVGDINKGINNRLRLRLLEQRRREIRKITGKDCSICRYMKYCFCPVGHYIFFSYQNLDFKQYFPQFCRLSQIYIRSFLEIKRNLKTNPLFAKI